MILPDHDTLYAALIRRDPAYEGRALVGVTSTGIFCRLTCPARKPLAAHCRWFADAAGARAAGFRPCRRCHPEGVQADPAIAAGLALLAEDATRRWRSADLAARGLDASTLRRAFQRHFGHSFAAHARQARLAAGLRAISRGDAMIDAQMDAGFDSASGFRAGFERLFGHPPHALRRPGDLCADWIDTPLGGMIAVADDAALMLLEFSDRKNLAGQLRGFAGARIGLGRNAVTARAAAWLGDYMAGRGPTPDLALAPKGTEFQHLVWGALRQIPPGQTRSYAQIAAAIGRPRAVRAVAGANARNPIAIITPCHRVIGADGRLTGYAGGLWRKERLIAIERGYAAKGLDGTGPDL